MNKFHIKVIILFLIIIIIDVINIIKYDDKYKILLNNKLNHIVEVSLNNRGKIYDINGNLLVDNKKINNIVFIYNDNVNINETINKLSNVIDNYKTNDNYVIEYYKYLYNENNLLNDDDINLIKNRKVNKNDLINEKILSNIYDDSFYKKAYIYYLINDGYKYEDKIIIKDASDEEINKVLNNNIEGIYIKESYERYYPYGNTLKDILGRVGLIPKESKDDYLDNNYALDDYVGLSGLEKYYEDYLKEDKEILSYDENGYYTVLKEGKKGNDLYLSIDINMQIYVDKLVEDNILKAKNYPDTNYFSDTYVIIGNPNTGEIYTISGKRLINNEFKDVAINNITSSFTVGSIVKGASMSVAYYNNVIDKKELINDGCVKLYGVPSKCSFKKLGYLDNIKALEQSSNYYQFIMAIRLLNKNYTYNMKLDVTLDDFNRYRNMFKLYGLGDYSNIDLPGEKLGIEGSKVSDDLYLNLSIGQYDTYTPINLFTYINTIANYGNRTNASLVKYIKDEDNIIYENNYDVVGSIPLKEEDINDIRKGFYNVIHYGTGKGFVSGNIDAAGKTGTAQSYFEGHATITQTAGVFWPYDDPKYSIIIVSPNISISDDDDNYTYYITPKILRNITSYIESNK